MFSIKTQSSTPALRGIWVWSRGRRDREPCPGKRRNNVEEEGSNGDTEKGAISNVIGEISRPATTSSVPELVEFVSSVERKEGFSDERIGEVEMAVREALTTIIQATAGGQSGDITVTCRHDHWGKLMVTIEDRGEAFNILLADVVFQGEQDPVDEKRRTSARLIKKMIDNIEQKRVDATNVLTFVVSQTLRTKH
jgi:anti-sigma regulatory factor (Ser/Thr protein kinase)